MPDEIGQIGDLARQRCFNHALREAAARCPQCRRFFCRECVTEHEGRVMCASCLRRPAAGPARGLLAWRLVGYAGGLAGLAAAWAMFYCLGRLLLLLPTSFHEGTMWAR